MDGTNSLLAAALAYGARHWPVIPIYSITGRICSCPKGGDCPSPGKHPRTKHGIKDASTDEAAIRRWWGDWPDANIAIATGAASSLLMIGPDGEQGISDLERLGDENGGLPETACQESGSGGRHYLFSYPGDGPRIPNRTNHLDTRIDVRGDGGYFLVDPSVNLNGPYRWILSPEHTRIAAAPDWLLEWCRCPKRAADPPRLRAAAANSNQDSLIRRAVAYLARIPAAVSGQGGHGQTFEAARVLVYGFALGPDLGLQILLEHYNPRCQPPWSERELRHKVEEADRVPFGKPKGWLADAPPPGGGSPVSENGTATSRTDPPDARPPDEPTANHPQQGWEVIRDYFRARYGAGYRTGEAAYCNAERREIRRQEACAALPPELMAALGTSVNVPRLRGSNGQPGEVNVESLPGFFKKWVGTGWTAFLSELPDEDGAGPGAVEVAAEEFRRLVRQAMFSEFTLSRTVRDNRGGKENRIEHRSAISWCETFSRNKGPGGWHSIRSKKLWFRLADVGGGECRLRIALRHELFGQLKADRRLIEMGSNSFTRRAKRYGVGLPGGQADRPGGKWALILADDFVADLISDLPEDFESCTPAKSATSGQSAEPQKPEDQDFESCTPPKSAT